MNLLEVATIHIRNRVARSSRGLRGAEISGAGQRRRDAFLDRRWCGEVVVRRVDFGAWRHDLVDPVEHILTQFHVRACQEIIELLACAEADQDGCDGRVRPGERGSRASPRRADL